VTPSNPHRLARLYALVVVLLLVLGAAATVWVRAELTTLAPPRAIELYSWALTFHAWSLSAGVAPLAITATLGYVLLPGLLGRAKLELSAVGYVGLVAIPTGVALAAAETPIGVRALPLGLLPLCTLSLGLGSISLGVPLVATCLASEHPRVFGSPFALGLLIVGLGHLLVGGLVVSAMLGLIGPSALRMLEIPETWVEFCALALITQVIAGSEPLEGRVRTMSVLALSALGAAAMLDWLAASQALPDAFRDVSVALGMLGGTVLPLLWWRWLREPRLPAGPVRLFVAAFVLSFVVRWFDAAYMGSLSVHVHLDDTYMRFGLDHLRTSTALFLALPAGVLWCWPQLGLARAPQAGWWWTAGRLCGLAVPTFAITAAVLGYSGMPIRYYVYLPEYWPLQVLLTVVSVGLAIGTLCWLVDLGLAWRWLSGRDRPGNPTTS
jgi:heme/copper-type cytochrome/quinol oxidase subunit 1